MREVKLDMVARGVSVGSRWKDVENGYWWAVYFRTDEEENKMMIVGHDCYTPIIHNPVEDEEEYHVQNESFEL